MSGRTVFIYGVYTNEERIVRYVGRAVDPIDRLRGHGSQAPNANFRAWVSAVRGSGCRLHVMILEVCFSNKDSLVAESKWIAHYRKRLGAALLNASQVDFEGVSDFSADDHGSMVMRHIDAARILGLSLPEYYRKSADLLAESVVSGR